MNPCEPTRGTVTERDPMPADGGAFAMRRRIAPTVRARRPDGTPRCKPGTPPPGLDSPGLDSPGDGSRRDGTIR